MKIKLTDEQGTAINEMTSMRTGDYALFPITKTMLTKSIMDCNVPMQEIVKSTGIANYEQISEGEKVIDETILVFRRPYEKSITLKTSFYRAKTRGDARIWFTGLPKHAETGDVGVLFTLHKKLCLLVYKGEA
mgnify:FL=1